MRHFTDDTPAPSLPTTYEKLAAYEQIRQMLQVPALDGPESLVYRVRQMVEHPMLPPVEDIPIVRPTC